MRSFSIVVLTYNNYKLLDIAFKSLASQRLIDDMYSQLVIVDDGTDNLTELDIKLLIDKYKLTSMYMVKIIINKINLGTVKSFNKAISICDGEVILPLAADDEFYDELVVFDIVNFFERNINAEIVTCLRTPVDNGVELPSLPPKKTWELFNEPSKLYDYISLRGNIISGSSTYYRKSFISNRGFDEAYRYIEDFPLYLDFLNNGGKIHFLSRVTIKYSMSGISSKITKDSIIYDDYIKIWSNILILNKGRGFFYHRFVFFNHILTEDERKSFYNKFFYFDIFLIKILLRFYKTFRPL